MFDLTLIVEECCLICLVLLYMWESVPNMSFLKLKLSFSGNFTLESRVNNMGILVIWYYEISNIEREREKGVKVEKLPF